MPSIIDQKPKKNRKWGGRMLTLGAWIGNRIEDITPWEPIINKINTKLG